MNVITSAVQAVGLFLVTNIDDIIVLSLFFARGAGQRHLTAKLTAGQYLGFAGILAAMSAGTLGAATKAALVGFLASKSPDTSGNTPGLGWPAVRGG